MVRKETAEEELEKDIDEDDIDEFPVEEDLDQLDQTW
jgi:hypothetical protein